MQPARPGGNRKRHGDPPLGLARLVCLGVDGWDELVGVVKASGVYRAVEVVARAVEEPETEELELPAAGSNELSPGYHGIAFEPDAGQAWWEIERWDEIPEERTVWGDLSAQGRRRLKELLEG